MDQPPISPENMPASEMEMLLYRLQSLFLEYDPGEPAPWIIRRYIDGRKENVLEISHSPDTGSYLFGASLKDHLLMIQEDRIINDTLTPDERFFSGRNAAAGDVRYDEYRAKLFNDLLIRSTRRPYGMLGRMFLRAMRGRYRWAI